VYFKEGYYGFDDGNFAALKLLEYLSSKPQPVSEIIATTPHYITTPAYHAQTPESRKYQIVDALVQQFKREGYRVVEISGGRVYMHGGWGLIRATSNLDAVEVRFEAKTEADLQKIQAEFKAKLAQFPEVSTEWESA
jgi:phosphomannomutase